jgi:hypothetical protein
MLARNGKHLHEQLSRFLVFPHVTPPPGDTCYQAQPITGIRRGSSLEHHPVEKLELELSTRIGKYISDLYESPSGKARIRDGLGDAGCFFRVAPGKALSSYEPYTVAKLIAHFPDRI